MNAEKAPRKPRLHDDRAWRWPSAPLKLGVFKYAAGVFLRRLQTRQLPAGLAAIIEREDEANRSDGLESVFLVVAALLAFTSLKSFRVGFRQRRGHGFDLVGVCERLLVAYTGLSASTISHVCTVLRHAGYVHGPGRDGVNVIKQPWETIDGKREPLPAIRRFTFAFFADLGLGPLIAERRKGPPAPPPAATVDPESARKLLSALAVAKSTGPPE